MSSFSSVEMKLGDVRSRLSIFEQQKERRISETNKSLLFLKSDLKQGLVRLERLQLKQKEEWANLMNGIESSLTKSKQILHATKKAENLAFNKAKYLQTVMQQSVPWLERQTALKASKILQAEEALQSMVVRHEQQTELFFKQQKLEAALRERQTEFFRQAETERTESVLQQLEINRAQELSKLISKQHSMQVADANLILSKKAASVPYDARVEYYRLQQENENPINFKLDSPVENKVVPEVKLPKKKSPEEIAAEEQSKWFATPAQESSDISKIKSDIEKVAAEDLALKLREAELEKNRLEVEKREEELRHKFALEEEQRKRDFEAKKQKEQAEADKRLNEIKEQARLQREREVKAKLDEEQKAKDLERREREQRLKLEEEEIANRVRRASVEEEQILKRDKELKAMQESIKKEQMEAKQKELLKQKELEVQKKLQQIEKMKQDNLNLLASPTNIPEISKASSSTKSDPAPKAEVAKPVITNVAANANISALLAFQPNAENSGSSKPISPTNVRQGSAGVKSNLIISTGDATGSGMFENVNVDSSVSKVAETISPRSSLMKSDFSSLLPPRVASITPADKEPEKLSAKDTSSKKVGSSALRNFDLDLDESDIVSSKKTTEVKPIVKPKSDPDDISYMFACSSMLRQVNLISAGCQTWNRSVISANSTYFCYCSTLAIYVYDLSTFELVCLLAGHDRTITSLVKNPDNYTQFVTCAVDKKAILWNVEKQDMMAWVTLPHVPVGMEWVAQEEAIFFLFENGECWSWSLRGLDEVKLNQVDIGVRAKVIRANHNTGPLQLFVSDNEECFIYSSGKNAEIDFGECKMAPIIDVKWDPLSNLYLLLATTEGLYLIDSESRRVQMQFDSFSDICMLSWIPHAPGTFAVANTSTATLRLYNVSQKSPTDVIKLSTNATGCFAIVSIENNILCSFTDGSVSMFDLESKTVKFKTSVSHSETIFDCRFSTNGILATASYDSTIKLWDVNNLTCEQTLQGQSGVIFSVAWEPNTSNRIASASSKGDVCIWNTSTGQMLKRLSLHNGPIYRVLWGAEFLASSSGDSKCVIFTELGEVLRIYNHPAAVYGCDIDPFKKCRIATGCNDGKVRIFSLPSKDIVDSASPTSPISEFNVHASRVFHVVWSPLVPNLLCSGSDDKTIAIITTDTGKSSKLLGHSNFVRALVWHSELDYILLSGSWDGTIRVWDIRNLTCLAVAKDHHADVYGLASPPSRPFFFASSSRDTSLRFWNLELNEVIAAKYQSILSGGLLADNYFQVSTEKKSGTISLCGAAGKNLNRELKGCSSKLERLRLVTNFFMYLPGLSNMFTLLDTILNGESINDTIVHFSHASILAISKANKILKPALGVTAGKLEDRIKSAAELMLHAGNFEDYCEMMIQINNWDRAVAVAPAVSLDYWRDICSRAATASKDPAYLIASGDLKHAIRGVNKISKISLIQSSKQRRVQSSSLEQISTIDYSADLLDELDDLAEFELRNGRAVVAANFYLAMNDLNRAVNCLLRGNEPLIAYIVSILCQLPLISPIKMMIPSMAVLKLWREIWQLEDSPELEQLKCLCCSYFDGNKNSLYREVGIRSVESFLEDKGGSVTERVYNLVMADQSLAAIELALPYLNEIISKKSWNIIEVRPILQSLNFLNAEILPEKFKIPLLCYSLYVGAIDAMNFGVDYGGIVLALFDRLVFLVTKNSFQFPIPTYLLTFQKLSFLLFSNHSARENDFLKLIADPLLPPSYRSSIESRLKWIQDGHFNKCSKGCHNGIVPSGNGLPTGASKLLSSVSSLSGEKFYGLRYVAEDSSVCSVSEILMWRQVCPFSPALTGKKIPAHI